jgi:hypothetical protein
VARGPAGPGRCGPGPVDSESGPSRTACPAARGGHSARAPGQRGAEGGPVRAQPGRPARPARPGPRKCSKSGQGRGTEMVERFRRGVPPGVSTSVRSAAVDSDLLGLDADLTRTATARCSHGALCSHGAHYGMTTDNEASASASQCDNGRRTRESQTAAPPRRARRLPASGALPAWARGGGRRAGFDAATLRGRASRAAARGAVRPHCAPSSPQRRQGIRVADC